MANSDIRKIILAFVKLAIDSSQGRLALVMCEKDSSSDPDPEIGNFMKLDGTRLGRDVEGYVLLGSGRLGRDQFLIPLLEEVYHRLPMSSKKAAGEFLRKQGETFYRKDPKLLRLWNLHFVLEEVAAP